ncbi:Exosomal 3'-5' exoribonuclease complex subunit Rrp40 [Ceraceosorus bombacis]|uniref:Exosomal 3'-5' exoribonuclease complex subunit Rrp40 n=1 Tax=Ceraceosorus bombacis TaxID=401625 RepID=A0A0P1BRB1_9BASI|nr:Exosomal 3'-5' exoribonuclease complex subunit Rrp40 [Ceraceosorus bombacis]
MSAVVLPGDVSIVSAGPSSLSGESSKQRTIKLGPGLIRSSRTAEGSSDQVKLKATRMGTFKNVEKAKSGATKRNRPNLNVGTLVYAKILPNNNSRESEPELTCVNPMTGKAEGFGELKVADKEVEEQDERKRSTTMNKEKNVAMCWDISLALARALFTPQHTLLPNLASHFPFEAATGHNGKIWVQAGCVEHLIAFGKVLQKADVRRNRWSENHSHSRSNDAIAKKEQLSEDVAALRGELDKAVIREIVADLV